VILSLSLDREANMNAEEFVLSLMDLARRKGCIALASFTDQHCGLPGCRKFHPRNILVARPNGTLEAWWNRTPLHSNVELLDASREIYDVDLAARLAEEWLEKAREALSSPLLAFEDIPEQARLDMEARPWVFAYLDHRVGDRPIGYVDYPSGYRLAIVSAESPEFEQELPQGSILLFGPIPDHVLGWLAVVALPPRGTHCRMARKGQATGERRGARERRGGVGKTPLSVRLRVAQTPS
jgi:hypothetical protein